MLEIFQLDNLIFHVERFTNSSLAGMAVVWLPARQIIGRTDMNNVDIENLPRSFFFLQIPCFQCRPFSRLACVAATLAMLVWSPLSAEYR